MAKRRQQTSHEQPKLSERHRLPRSIDQYSEADTKYAKALERLDASMTSCDELRQDLQRDGHLVEERDEYWSQEIGKKTAKITKAQEGLIDFSIEKLPPFIKKWTLIEAYLEALQVCLDAYEKLDPSVQGKHSGILRVAKNGDRSLQRIIRDTNPEVIARLQRGINYWQEKREILTSLAKEEQRSPEQERQNILEDIQNSVETLNEREWMTLEECEKYIESTYKQRVHMPRKNKSHDYKWRLVEVREGGTKQRFLENGERERVPVKKFVVEGRYIGHKDYGDAERHSYDCYAIVTDTRAEDFTWLYEHEPTWSSVENEHLFTDEERAIINAVPMQERNTQYFLHPEVKPIIDRMVAHRYVAAAVEGKNAERYQNYQHTSGQQFPDDMVWKLADSYWDFRTGLRDADYKRHKNGELPKDLIDASVEYLIKGKMMQLNEEDARTLIEQAVESMGQMHEIRRQAVDALNTWYPAWDWNHNDTRMNVGMHDGSITRIVLDDDDRLGRMEIRFKHGPKGDILIQSVLANEKESTRHAGKSLESMLQWGGEEIAYASLDKVGTAHADKLIGQIGWIYEASDGNLSLCDRFMREHGLNTARAYPLVERRVRSTQEMESKLKKALNAEPNSYTDFLFHERIDPYTSQPEYVLQNAKKEEVRLTVDRLESKDQNSWTEDQFKITKIDGDVDQDTQAAILSLSMRSEETALWMREFLTTPAAKRFIVLMTENFPVQAQNVAHFLEQGFKDQNYLTGRTRDIMQDGEKKQMAEYLHEIVRKEHLPSIKEEELWQKGGDIYQSLFEDQNIPSLDKDQMGRLINCLYVAHAEYAGEIIATLHNGSHHIGYPGQPQFDEAHLTLPKHRSDIIIVSERLAKNEAFLAAKEGSADREAVIVQEWQHLKEQQWDSFGNSEEIDEHGKPKQLAFLTIVGDFNLRNNALSLQDAQRRFMAHHPSGTGPNVLINSYKMRDFETLVEAVAAFREEHQDKHIILNIMAHGHNKGILFDFEYDYNYGDEHSDMTYYEFKDNTPHFKNAVIHSCYAEPSLKKERSEVSSLHLRGVATEVTHTTAPLDWGEKFQDGMLMAQSINPETNRPFCDFNEDEYPSWREILKWIDENFVFNDPTSYDAKNGDQLTEFIVPGIPQEMFV